MGISISPALTLPTAAAVLDWLRAHPHARLRPLDMFTTPVAVALLHLTGEFVHFDSGPERKCYWSGGGCELDTPAELLALHDRITAAALKRDRPRAHYVGETFPAEYVLMSDCTALTMTGAEVLRAIGEQI